MTRALALIALAGCSSTSPTESIAVQATTVCAGADVVHGMDVSSYETSINWKIAKDAGIDFAFIRVSDGLQFKDPKFATYWSGAHAAGVMRGAYQFFRPTQDPIAQADLLLQAIGPRQPGDLPPVIDVESTGGLAADKVEAAVRAWVDHVTQAIGRPPIVYAGYYSWQDYTGNANLTASPLWHAQYTTAPCPNIPTPWTHWTFWQHSSTGTVPAVLGETTDLNVFDGSLAELQAFADHAPDACGTIDPLGGDIDDADPCFSAGGPAATLRHVTDAGMNSSLVWTRATASALPGNFAQWSLVFAEAGRYRLEAYTAAAHAQSKRAMYRVRADGVTSEVVLDQSAVDGWQTLGELAFAAGRAQYVQLDDNTGETGGPKLAFDAIRVTRLDPPPEVEPADDGGCSSSRGGSAWLVLLVLAAIGRATRRPR